MTKTAIVNLLNRKYGFRRFLEISTMTTGKQFAEIDATHLDVRHRLVYHCPEDYDDGESYTFRTSQPFSHELIDAILAVSPRPLYESILVDPYHSYQCSIADLRGALAMLAPGGVIVVHDCAPDAKLLVGEDFHDGAWCGETYAAFLDVALSSNHLSSYTVDCDYGCGVIYKKPIVAPIRPKSPEDRARLLYRWTVAREDGEQRYRFYEKHRRELLNLVSPEGFLTMEGVDYASATLPMTVGSVTGSLSAIASS